MITDTILFAFSWDEYWAQLSCHLRQGILSFHSLDSWYKSCDLDDLTSECVVTALCAYLRSDDVNDERKVAASRDPMEWSSPEDDVEAFALRQSPERNMNLLTPFTNCVNQWNQLGFEFVVRDAISGIFNSVDHSPNSKALRNHHQSNEIRKSLDESYFYLLQHVNFLKIVQCQ